MTRVTLTLFHVTATTSEGEKRTTGAGSYSLACQIAERFLGRGFRSVTIEAYETFYEPRNEVA